MLIGLGAGFTIIGSRFSPDTRRLREFCARNRLPHRWIDLETDDEAEALLRELGIDPGRDAGRDLARADVLRNPSNADLARPDRARQPSAPDEASATSSWSGPGRPAWRPPSTALPKGWRRSRSTPSPPGGRRATSSKIENYLGFPSGISGAELAERATIQAEKFGARISVPAEATSLRREDGHYVVGLDDGESVVGTHGRDRDGSPVPQARRAAHGGVRGCECLLRRDPDGGTALQRRSGRGRGGGNSAGQATMFLAQLRRTGAPDRARGRPGGAHVALSDRPDRAQPERAGPRCTRRCANRSARTGSSSGVVVEDNQTGERRTIDARMLFVFIGAQPHTRWLAA